MADVKELLLAAGLMLSEDALEKMDIYHAMLIEWNEKMDLTSVSRQDMAVRHFLDSLLPLKTAGLIPESGRLIDVGTGAGFPGLPLAIARPELGVTLLEAQGKRCKFLAAVCEALGLSNVEIINDRAEILGRSETHREEYDRAVARAVAPLNILCEYLLPFVRQGGSALCWKGPAVWEEIRDGKAAARALGGEMGEVLDLSVPQMDTTHLVVRIHKNEKTLPQYPRKNGIPAKRPLKDDEA